jgi:CubicO group peptidase (beta-lactamase class C family)
LASLTKVAATTVLVMKAVDRGLLSLQTLLADLNLGISKDQKPLTIEHLLTHQSGFPAWRPFHVDPELADKDRLLKAIVRERLLFEPGQATVYSDLNFLLLGLILEKLWAASLSELFDREVAAPLELKVTGYDSKGFAAAPTEDGPRVGGPLGWPGALILGAVPTGRVHDDNAAALGGAAGHAGLFGSAPELWRIVRDLAKTWSKDEGVLCRRRTLTAFMAVRSTPVDPGRAAGFDIGQGPLAGAFGHLGYTGGSIWWDPAGDRAFVFLSNRVHPTARNSKITGFRRQLAEILWPALG